ncbi:ribosomal protein S18 acetylase RimI-like enzyme [Paenibacillus shirakamiensis]|uniref:Ribosomal protein S18 acetylase RimI-like enzyme n=1 Tax=Paenibacillus shirakamiensis TaxID=1265935 RepID=A0ABS4JFK9_9BACL|nr:GNAT family N-acetyltransferase [Paenibacillus shirakamiensis]MBP2000493.1 ribosomal protein S18 acetylase RimI-like enzyme [Paenibacillus shirakamiensis]
MIRYRRPRQDDPVIYRLIEQELVPHSHLSKGSLDAVIRELPKRLTRGVTLIGSPNYEADAVAFVHFMIHGDLLYIDMMAVAPAEQRKRYGKTLLSQAESFATSRGCNRAKVMVDKDNKRAKVFYKKLGYKTTRYVPISLCYEMEKTLHTRFIH